MERDCLDEYEEGEIIDDFEDISDYSIPSTSYSGKSVTHRDLLQDVSLSSISDNEDAARYINTCNSRHRHMNMKRRRKPIHCHQRKRHKYDICRKRKFGRCKYFGSAIINSDSEDELDEKTQRQLKDAIRIENSQIRHNSLRTRLKAMLQSENVQSKSEGEDEDIETLRTLALLSSVKDENVISDDVKSTEIKLINENIDDKDEELIELRLAALKSAVLKKVPEIRKRKFKLHPSQDDNSCEINKENNVNQENNVQDDLEKVKDAGSLDNVKKSTNDSVISESKKNDISKNTTEEDVDIMRAKLLASMSKKITLNIPKSSILTKEIQIGAKITKPNHSVYKNTNVKVKPLIINLNDSDSDTDVTTRKDQNNVTDKDISLVNSVSEFLRRQRAAVEAKNNRIKPLPTIKEAYLDKSVVKLLPKPQQKEYHFLKQKLLMAKRIRVRKATLKLDNSKILTSRKFIKDASNGGTNMKQCVEPKPLGLQKALDDIQITKNGRLQMKGKYKALAPLLQKVNQASIERKQCEFEIKMLLDSLQKSRDKLAVSHQKYTNMVKLLTNQKSTIDRRIKVYNIVNNNVNIAKATSTPVKSDLQEPVCDISSIQISDNNVKEDIILSNNNNIDDVQENTNVNSDPLPTIPICEEENNLKYVSPLDSKNRDTVEDPLITFCPFELFGVCKDPECKFNHCSKT